MKIRSDRFFIGASYYPPFHSPEDWERDTANMARAGMTMMRTAELLSSWDYIEPRRGEPEWDWLDRLFDLSQQHDIQILLGTGSCSPPIWLLEEYPDLQRVSREGVPYPTNAMWGWACINNPGLRNEVARYVRLLLERYGDHPMLYAWQIDNQIGHSAAFHEGESSRTRQYAYFCYCDHCARLFREWVKAKYGDIEALNEAWSWDPTHYRYYGWHQIRPPRSTPAEWGNNTAWLDFRRFVKGSFTDFVRFQHALIKDYDEKQITVHNLYHTMRPDLGARKEPDHWAIGGATDIIGHDIYPSENNFPQDPSFNSWFLDFAYSVAHHNERTMWIPELESGPIGGYSAGPNFATNGLDIKRFNLVCIGHGAKCLLYQGYRDWNCIPLTWGALVDFHGDPTERYHVAADVIRVVDEHEDFFLDALPPQAQVGIYHSQDNIILQDGQANEKFLYKALRGVHEALWQAGYTIQFVEPRFLGSETAVYEVLFLPFVMHVPRENAQKLTEFVAQGGTVIAFAKLGHMDDRGWAWNDRPGGGLTTLFGARETAIEVFREPHEALDVRVVPDDPLFAGIEAHTVQGYWHRQSLEIGDDVDVLARFADGEPAIIRRRHGQGAAILIATHLDMAVWENKSHSSRQLLANLVALCGVEKELIVEGAAQAYVDERVDAHLLSQGAQHAVVITNEGQDDVELSIAVPAAGQLMSAVELFSGDALPISAGAPSSISLELAAWDGAIILLNAHSAD